MQDLPGRGKLRPVDRHGPVLSGGEADSTQGRGAVMARTERPPFSSALYHPLPLPITDDPSNHPSSSKL
jgi:hypothetical protein